MALTENDVNTTQPFKSVKTIDLPVQVAKTAPNRVTNPYTGVPQTNAYARKHHLVNAGPDSVFVASEQTDEQ